MKIIGPHGPKTGTWGFAVHSHRGRADAFLSFMFSFLLGAAVLGFPLVAIVSTIVDQENDSISLAYRVAIDLVSVGVIVYALAATPFRTLGGVPRPVKIIAVLYVVRLVTDYGIGLPGVETAAIYFLGITILPMMALTLIAPYRNPTKDLLLLLGIGAAFCISFVLLSVSHNVSLMDATSSFYGRESLARLNPISVGHAGVSTLIVAVSFVYSDASKWKKITVLLVAAAAIACVILSGSRGPLVSVVIAFLLLILLQRKWIMLIAVMLVAQFIFFNLTTVEGGFLERLLAVGSDSTSVERVTLQQDAFYQFLGSPLFGSAYLELNSLTYPHNIIVDAAMSMGIVGLILMLWIIISAWAVAMKRLWRTEILLPLLFVQYALAVQFSGSLYSSPEFWILAGCILAQNNGVNKKACADPDLTLPRSHKRVQLREYDIPMPPPGYQ